MEDFEEDDEELEAENTEDEELEDGEDEEDLDEDFEDEEDDDSEEDDSEEEDDDSEDDEEKKAEQLQKKMEEFEKLLEKIEATKPPVAKLEHLPKLKKLAKEIGPSAATTITKLEKIIREEIKLDKQLKELEPIASSCGLGKILSGLILTKKARKYKSLKMFANSVEIMLYENLASKIARYAEIIFYALLGAAAIALIVFLFLFIAAFFDSIFGGGGGSSDTANSQFGVQGTDFYAVRTVYKDDEQATKDIVEDYISYVSGSVAKAKARIEENPDYSLTITLEIPTESIAENVLDETKEEYNALRTVFGYLVEEAYLYDNPSGPLNGLTDRVNAIKYMGIDEYLKTQFTTILTDTTNGKGLYQYFTVEDKEHTPIDVTETVNTSVNEVMSEAKLARTEKLYIKDYVLDGEGRMSDIAKEQYLAAIFLPRRNLTFTQLYVAVWNTDRSNFEMHIVNGDSTFEFTNIYEVDAQAYPGKYCYETNSSFSVPATAFAAGLEVKAGEQSLLSIAKEATAGATYLEQKTDEEVTSISYYAFKIDGMRLEFASEQAFNFVEVETKVS